MLFVSHDRHFLAALSNRVLELTPKGVHQYGGGYTEYVARHRPRGPGAAELRRRATSRLLIYEQIKGLIFGTKRKYPHDFFEKRNRS